MYRHLSRAETPDCQWLILLLFARLPAEKFYMYVHRSSIYLSSLSHNALISRRWRGRDRPNKEVSPDLLLPSPSPPLLFVCPNQFPKTGGVGGQRRGWGKPLFLPALVSDSSKLRPSQQQEAWPAAVCPVQSQIRCGDHASPSSNMESALVHLRRRVLLLMGTYWDLHGNILFAFRPS